MWQTGNWLNRTGKISSIRINEAARTNTLTHTHNMSQTKSCRGVSRVLSKLEESINSGKYYEAHQKYRTLYFRYLSQKRFDECLELLYDGAIKLLENHQYSSGADLGLLVVDTLEKTTINDIEFWIHRLGALMAKIPANLVERETLLVSKMNTCGNAFFPSYIVLTWSH